ncbi:uncharacterized protein SOCE836_081000 [Sorangium cellulosum]|uniref:Uncharacterized protein n=1 Tax=Sorangium cellulosum TaxID=56 RepID=A0A4P2QZZ4_SORCE|nr:uncharacterized protein SOCE836_081000 [Sorangium cellulosum]WCQ95198.1 hypothetical protein NQZ70_07974 [Sorangium sp. Soce836]
MSDDVNLPQGAGKLLATHEILGVVIVNVFYK